MANTIDQLAASALTLAHAGASDKALEIMTLAELTQSKPSQADMFDYFFGSEAQECAKNAEQYRVVTSAAQLVDVYEGIVREALRNDESPDRIAFKRKRFDGIVESWGDCLAQYKATRAGKRGAAKFRRAKRESGMHPPDRKPIKLG